MTFLVMSGLRCHHEHEQIHCLREETVMQLVRNSDKGDKVLDTEKRYLEHN